MRRINGGLSGGVSLDDDVGKCAADPSEADAAAAAAQLLGQLPAQYSLHRRSELEALSSTDLMQLACFLSRKDRAVEECLLLLTERMRGYAIPNEVFDQATDVCCRWRRPDVFRRLLVALLNDDQCIGDVVRVAMAFDEQDHLYAMAAECLSVVAEHMRNSNAVFEEVLYECALVCRPDTLGRLIGGHLLNEDTSNQDLMAFACILPANHLIADLCLAQLAERISEDRTETGLDQIEECLYLRHRRPDLLGRLLGRISEDDWPSVFRTSSKLTEASRRELDGWRLALAQGQGPVGLERLLVVATNTEHAAKAIHRLVENRRLETDFLDALGFVLPDVEPVLRAILAVRPSTEYEEGLSCGVANWIVRLLKHDPGYIPAEVWERTADLQGEFSRTLSFLLREPSNYGASLATQLVRSANGKMSLVEICSALLDELLELEDGYDVAVSWLYKLIAGVPSDESRTALASVQGWFRKRLGGAANDRVPDALALLLAFDKCSSGAPRLMVMSPSDELFEGWPRNLSCAAFQFGGQDLAMLETLWLLLRDRWFVAGEFEQKRWAEDLRAFSGAFGLNWDDLPPWIVLPMLEAIEYGDEIWQARRTGAGAWEAGGYCGDEDCVGRAVAKPLLAGADEGCCKECLQSDVKVFLDNEMWPGPGSILHRDVRSWHRRGLLRSGQQERLLQVMRRRLTAPFSRRLGSRANLDLPAISEHTNQRGLHGPLGRNHADLRGRTELGNLDRNGRA